MATPAFGGTATLFVIIEGVDALHAAGRAAGAGGDEPAHAVLRHAGVRGATTPTAT